MSPDGSRFLFLAAAACAMGIFLGWQQTLLPALQSILPDIWTSPILVRDRTRQITYLGTKENNVEIFHNIFYAEDTSGTNRFQPPITLKLPAGAMVDGRTPGAMCPQAKADAAFPFTSPTTNTSENCLSLKIARPAGTKQAAELPVLVYLHGGGAILGSGSDQLYRPNGLIQQSVANGQPVMFVGVNYRLGFFGFAATKQLRKEKSMNNGLRDQRMAFDWIKANIRAFGGDTDRITAVGQSVGASHIALHMLSYAGEKGVPFERVIAMSGASGQNFASEGSVVSDNTVSVARSVGCLKGSVDSAATLTCLREASMQELEDASIKLARELHPPFGEYGFYPQVDGDYIPKRPSTMFRQGQFVKGLPTIGSWTANDGAWYVPQNLEGDDAIAASYKAFAVDMREETLQRMVALYPAEMFEHLAADYPKTTVDYHRAAQLHRDAWFTCPVITFTWQLAKHGNPNVRIYEMNATKFGPVMDAIGFPYWRVLHLSDVPYLLNNDVPGSAIPIDNGPAQAIIAQRLSSSVVAFAYSGDPTSTPPDVDGLDWPTAYAGVDDAGLRRDFPQKVTVQVFGGLHGTGPAEVHEAARPGASSRERALHWERMLQRCAFIDSIADEIGV